MSISSNKLDPVRIVGAREPVRIIGPALIEAGAGPGIFIQDTPDVVIRDVTVIGATNGLGKDAMVNGVEIRNTSERSLEGVTLDKVHVEGFGGHGILIDTDGSYGFHGVSIDGCRSLNNAQSGITIWSKVFPSTPHVGIAIKNCKAYRCKGIPGLSYHTGNGIVASGFRGGLIQACEAYENGALCNATETGGPAGIWMYNCEEGIIERCHSHHNHSNNDADGGGFDFDGGTKNSTMRYNVSSFNDGYGYQLWDFFWDDTFHNEIHDNVSWLDNQALPLGAFSVFGKASASSIHHNRTLLKSGCTGMRVRKWTGSDLRIHDNAYLTEGASQYLTLEDDSPSPYICRDTFHQL